MSTSFNITAPPLDFSFQKTDSFYQLFEFLICLLERVSDESFWNSFVSERVMNLLKKYFGSDVVFLGVIVYIAPIIGYKIQSIYYSIYSYIHERMYVAISISEDEMGFYAIEEFITSQISDRKNLREAKACCFNDDNDDSDSIANPPPKVRLFPLDEIPQCFYYKGYKLWVTKTKNGNGDKANDDYYDNNNIKEFFSKMNTNPCFEIVMRGQDITLLKTFIQEWMNKHYEVRSEKLTIYKCLPTRYDSYDWEQVATKELRSFESVILKDGQKELILRDIQTFRRREDWYTCRGIPYRRGILLHGPPGTGKTSIVQSIASKVNMNVAIISLSGKMNDENFSVMLRDCPHNSILVMEDIDHCYISDPSSGNNDSSSKITMSGLLNALDGVAAQEGSMIFMTCNDMSKIQPALLRPGRIDMKMELGYTDKTQISRLFWRFMGKLDSENKLCEEKDKDLMEIEKKFVDMIPSDTVTPAELQNFFISNVAFNPDEDEVDYSYLLDKVPEFLETVERDRAQALEHKEKNTK
ncbi:P-loop containing nucleoside triphosphate hydrolase protein [Backusella circina FSU 941]|nr:P-loop containing nucleoside triphosphate hydrolase protein [Backusella circina FSU 941]